MKKLIVLLNLIFIGCIINTPTPKINHCYKYVSKDPFANFVKIIKVVDIKGKYFQYKQYGHTNLDSDHFLFFDSYQEVDCKNYFGE